MKTAATARAKNPAKNPAKDGAKVASPRGFSALGLFLPYQRAWINDASTIAVMRGSRRVGKDYADAYKSVLDRLSGRRVVDLNYSSRDEDTAREYIEYVKYFCKLAGFLAQTVWDVELFGTKEIKTGRITFPEVHGVRPVVRSLSSTPGSFRGRDGDIVLSELAFHESPEELWGAASPTTTLGGRIRVVSTVNSEGDFFERLCDMGRRRAANEPKPGDMPVSLHTVTIHDAIADGLVEMVNRTRRTDYTRASFLAECRAKCLDQDQWEREYECKASAQSGSYFPFALSRPCVDPLVPKPTEHASEFLAGVEARARALGATALYAGMDVGRRRDLTVVWVLARVGVALHTAGVLVLDRRSYAEQREAVNRLMEMDDRGSRAVLPGCRVHRLCGDATGIGSQIMEELVTRYRSRVEGVQVTLKVKADIYPGLRKHLEERTVTLPEDDATLADLASVRKEVTSSGNVRYAGERNEYGHADRACALTLAIHAAESKVDRSRCVQIMGGIDP